MLPLSSEGRLKNAIQCNLWKIPLSATTTVVLSLASPQHPGGVLISENIPASPHLLSAKPLGQKVTFTSLFYIILTQGLETQESYCTALSPFTTLASVCAHVCMWILEKQKHAFTFFVTVCLTTYKKQISKASTPAKDSYWPESSDAASVCVRVQLSAPCLTQRNQ